VDENRMRAEAPRAGRTPAAGPTREAEDKTAPSVTVYGRRVRATSPGDPNEIGTIDRFDARETEEMAQ
jgi:hypothetical protein